MKVTIPNGAHPAPDEPMDPEEILRRAEAFDPTQLSAEQKVRILTIALQCIQRFSGDSNSVKIATYALTECA